MQVQLYILWFHYFVSDGKNIKMLAPIFCLNSYTEFRTVKKWKQDPRFARGASCEFIC